MKRVLMLLGAAVVATAVVSARCGRGHCRHRQTGVHHRAGAVHGDGGGGAVRRTGARPSGRRASVRSHAGAAAQGVQPAHQGGCSGDGGGGRRVRLLVRLLRPDSLQHHLRPAGVAAVCPDDEPGSCFQKVNLGATANSAVKQHWDVEIALDLEAIHAVCQNCKIVLVEAENDSLGIARWRPNGRRTSSASIVSNSWGIDGDGGLGSAVDSAFNYPSHAIVVSSGDDGYAPSYPALLNTVISVGGTTLHVKSDGSVSERANVVGHRIGLRDRQASTAFARSHPCRSSDWRPASPPPAVRRVCAATTTSPRWPTPTRAWPSTPTA